MSRTVLAALAGIPLLLAACSSPAEPAPTAATPSAATTSQAAASAVSATPSPAQSATPEATATATGTPPSTATPATTATPAATPAATATPAVTATPTPSAGAGAAKPAGAPVPQVATAVGEFDVTLLNANAGRFPPLNDPIIVAASEATWLDSETLILGAVQNGEARAYPIAVMRFHHVSNDILGGAPYLVTF